MRKWFLGAFDAADVVSMCGGNDGKLWDGWWADVIATRHMNNKNRRGSVLATRDHSFGCRALSLNVIVRIV